MIKELEVIKIRGSSRETVMNKVAEEVPFHIYIEKNHYVTLMCSPENLVELGYGFLFFDGVIKKKEDVREIIDMGHTFCFQLTKSFVAKKEVSERAILSGCGKGSLHTSLIEDYVPEEKITHRIPIESERISELMKDFKDEGQVFIETGGVHRVALGDANGIICGFDDIGRHNAVDKNIGYALTHDISFDDKILFSTGRISSDLLAKAIKARIPLVISHTAPTTLAVEMGRASGVQIIGFARGKRMNIYA